MKRIVPFFALLSVFAACNNNPSNTDNTDNNTTTNEPQRITYNVVNTYPHNIHSFTEGLEWRDSSLYESTGNKGESKFAKINLTDGLVIKEQSLPKEYFGEGITILNGKIYMLTYEEQKCFVFDAKTFTKLAEFNYDGEGWGLTNNGKHLIMSNGSSNIYFRDPETFKVLNTISVTDNNGPVGNVNELEYVDGFIYANLWQTLLIVKVDATSGRVAGRLDFTDDAKKFGVYNSNIEDERKRPEAFNGIAYDSVGKRFFVTGKYWPKVFEIKLN